MFNNLKLKLKTMDFKFIEEMMGAKSGTVTDPAQIDVILDYLSKNYNFSVSDFMEDCKIVDIKGLFKSKIVFSLNNSCDKVEEILLKQIRYDFNKDRYIRFFYLKSCILYGNELVDVIAIHENSFYCAYIRSRALFRNKTFFKNYCNEIAKFYKNLNKEVAGFEVVKMNVEKEVGHEMD